MAVHHDVAAAVDSFLRGRELRPEIRFRNEAGDVQIEQAPPKAPGRNGHRMEFVEPEPSPRVPEDAERSLPLRRLYAYGVGLGKLRTAAQHLRVPMQLVDDLRHADAVVTIKSYYRKRPQPVLEAEERRIPVYVLRSNTLVQMEGFLAELFGVPMETDPLDTAMREAQDAIRQVMAGAASVDLRPQPAAVRRQQHQAARTANLISHSQGSEPQRYVRIYRD